MPDFYGSICQKELINILNEDYEENVIELCQKNTHKRWKNNLEWELEQLKKVRARIITQQEKVNNALKSARIENFVAKQEEREFKKYFNDLNKKLKQLKTSPV